MNNKLLLSALAALTITGLTVVALTGCGQGPATGSSSISSGSSMIVTVGDAPLSNILSAEVTISGITLTPSAGGSSVSAMSGSRVVELSSLGAIQEPLETDKVAAGTYNAASVTVSSAKVTYLDSSGKVVTGNATISKQNISVSLNPALTVKQGQDVQLRLNFNLAQSFDLTNSTLTFTPSVTSAAASIEKENETDREVEVTGSVVSISSSSITVKSANTGAQSTFSINSSTKFSKNTSASSIKTGSIVTVHGTIQSDGSLIATVISSCLHGSSIDSSQGGGRGIVTAVTTDGSGNVTAFTFVPREDFGDMSAPMSLNVSISSSTTYGVNEDAQQEGIAASAFNNSEIFPGQSVQVLGTLSGTTITAQEVDLAPESLSGTLPAAPQGTAPTYTFTLNLPKASFLTTYEKLTALDASTNAQTQYEDGLTASSFSSLAAGTNLELHGYLLEDTSGNFSLTVGDVSQMSSDH